MKGKFYSLVIASLSAAMTLMPTTTAFASETATETVAQEVDASASDYVALGEADIEGSGLVISPEWIIPRKYVVTGNNVDIRTGPGTNYTSVGRLYKGDILRVKEIDNGWAKFKYNGQWRYVSSAYISSTK